MTDHHTGDPFSVPAENHGDTDLLGELLHQANNIRRGELAARMGYRRVDEKLLARLDSVLNDNLLGLGTSGFDFRYTSDEFLVALCNALDIDPALRDAEHARIRALVNHRDTAFRPFVFVDTGFKRKNQPAFVLGLMERKRRLDFDRAFVDQHLGEQFATARRRIREHYRDTGGVLPIWGVIQRYLLQYAEEAVLIFDTAGRAVGETDTIRADHAQAFVAGRDASGVVPDLNAPDPDRAHD